MKKTVCVCVCLCIAALFAETVPGWKDLSATRIIPMKNLAPPARTDPGHFTFNADFTMVTDDRAYWDIPINMDLSGKAGISFDFITDEQHSVMEFTVYLKSGDGWYKGSFATPEDSGRQRVRVRKSALPHTENKVAGWRNVSMMRIAVWKSGTEKVSFGIADMSFIDGGTPLIGVVRPDSCEADPRFRSQRGSFTRYSSYVTRAMEASGVNTKEISDMDLDPGSVAGLKLLVFPFNPALPEAEEKTQILNDFTARGGKLFACHSAAPEIRQALGLDERAYRNRKRGGFSETPTACANGFYLPHVWRYPREVSERQAYNLLLQVDTGWKGRLDAARKRSERNARETSAWIASQPSKKGEWRAFWCHSARGMRGSDWDSSVRLLKENGFNALLPNLACGGTAFYRSSVLPVHESVETKGDALKECLAACRRYGVECHVWKMCWRLGRHTDKQVIRRLSSEGRLQRNVDGKELKWLCPTRPENLAAETDSFLELAGSGANGVHLDFIRYPGKASCFCDHCRKCFEKQLGRKVSGWPKSITLGKDAALTAAWRRFRCGNITALVRRVSERVRKKAPGVKISAAVFRTTGSNADRIGQDWVAWCREGLLDFVCPMNYCDSFSSMVSVQKRLTEGLPVRLRPGMGPSCWSGSVDDAVRLTKEIGFIRDLGLDGFAVFELDSRAARFLPVIHTGPTR